MKILRGQTFFPVASFLCGEGCYETFEALEWAGHKETSAYMFHDSVCAQLFQCNEGSFEKPRCKSTHFIGEQILHIHLACSGKREIQFILPGHRASHNNFVLSTQLIKPNHLEVQLPLYYIYFEIAQFNSLNKRATKITKVAKFAKQWPFCLSFSCNVIG